MINLFMTIAFILLTIVLFKFSLLISKKISFLNPILLTAIIIIMIKVSKAINKHEICTLKI